MIAHHGDSDAVVRKRFTLSLTLSLLIVLAGMAWTWHVGQEANSIDHTLEHFRDALEGTHGQEGHK